MRDRWGIDVESRGAPRDFLSLLKSPVATHPMSAPPPSSPDHNHPPGEDSANPGRYHLKFFGGPGRIRHFGLVFAGVIDSCNPSALVAPSALPSSE
jgi:hypothetical protein